MGTPKQIAALERARAARRIKLDATGGAAEAQNVPDLTTGIVAKVEVLWQERENGVARRLAQEPYTISYRCKECNGLVEEVAPQFLGPLNKVVRCLNPLHGGALTEMDY